MVGITHVIHCAGCPGCRISEFYKVNHAGTRNVMEAANAQPDIRRLVHISSLAASAATTHANPAIERDPAPPGFRIRQEQARRRTGGAPPLPPGVCRPPPSRGLRPARLGIPAAFQSGQGASPAKAGPQALSLVFVEDLAQVIVACLDHPAAARKTYLRPARKS